MNTNIWPASVEARSTAGDLLRAALAALDAEGRSLAAIHVSMALGVLGEREVDGAEPRTCFISV